MSRSAQLLGQSIRMYGAHGSRFYGLLVTSLLSSLVTDERAWFFNSPFWLLKRTAYFAKAMKAREVRAPLASDFGCHEIANDFDHLSDHFLGESGVGSKEHCLIHNAIGSGQGRFLNAELWIG